MGQFNLVLAGLLLLFAVACTSSTPKEAPVPVPPPVSPPVSQPSPNATITPVTPTTAVIPSPTAVPVAAIAAVAFSLDVLTPDNESVVHSPSLQITGRTTPDAVVSINGTLAEVDFKGNFSAMVTLQEGPNVIEVVASDFQGNKAGKVLTVIYVA